MLASQEAARARRGRRRIPPLASPPPAPQWASSCWAGRRSQGSLPEPSWAEGRPPSLAPPALRRRLRLSRAPSPPPSCGSQGPLRRTPGCRRRRPPGAPPLLVPLCPRRRRRPWRGTQERSRTCWRLWTWRPPLRTWRPGP